MNAWMTISGFVGDRMVCLYDMDIVIGGSMHMTMQPTIYSNYTVLSHHAKAKVNLVII